MNSALSEHSSHEVSEHTGGDVPRCGANQHRRPPPKTRLASAPTSYEAQPVWDAAAGTHSKLLVSQLAGGASQVGTARRRLSRLPWWGNPTLADVSITEVVVRCRAPVSRAVPTWLRFQWWDSDGRPIELGVLSGVFSGGVLTGYRDGVLSNRPARGQAFAPVVKPRADPHLPPQPQLPRSFRNVGPRCQHARPCPPLPFAQHAHARADGVPATTRADGRGGGRSGRLDGAVHDRGSSISGRYLLANPTSAVTTRSRRLLYDS